MVNFLSIALWVGPVLSQFSEDTMRKIPRLSIELLDEKAMSTRNEFKLLCQKEGRSMQYVMLELMAGYVERKGGSVGQVLTNG